MLSSVEEAVKDCNEGKADYQGEKNGIRYCMIQDLLPRDKKDTLCEGCCPYQGDQAEISRTVLDRSVIRYECNRQENS